MQAQVAQRGLRPVAFCLQFESQGVAPKLLEQTALLNVVTNNVPKLTQCRILNITSVS